MLFGPIGAYNGWGFMQPTQNLVEEFRMASGLPTGEDGSFDPQNPYVGREPRFYESIIYHKSTFSGKVYEINDLYDPASNLYTGYFRRKGISEPLNLGQEGYNFMFFRFAEVLLSYAEAKIELNEIDDTVLDAIDRVRRRGGLPSLEETYGKTTFMQAELRDVVRTERRIELAFEGKRYWDLIRWREAEPAAQPAGARHQLRERTVCRKERACHEVRCVEKLPLPDGPELDRHQPPLAGADHRRIQPRAEPRLLTVGTTTDRLPNLQAKTLCFERKIIS